MLGKSSARFFYFYQKDRLKYQLSRRRYGYSRKDFVLRNSASHHAVKEKIIIFIMTEVLLFIHLMVGVRNVTFKKVTKIRFISKTRRISSCDLYFAET